MSDSSFASEFHNSLISSETSSHFSFSNYFLHEYDRTYDFGNTLPLLLSQGTVSVTSPFSYESAGLDAFCLLYTKKGAGKLFCYTQSLPTPPRKIFVSFCRVPWPSSTAGSLTDSCVCIISGNIQSVLSPHLSAGISIKNWYIPAAAFFTCAKMPMRFPYGNTF